MSSAVKDLKNKKIKCKPFLKWVGGKTQLIPELFKRLPKNWNNYFEPFIGGGALYFNLQPTNAYLSDNNSELINAYNIVKNKPKELVKDLKKHIYEKNYFYSIRALDRTKEFSNLSSTERASRLIYLNKTCYNGLYRVNSKNQFNSPFGKYTNPLICDEENLYNCSSVLSKAKIEVKEFQTILEDAKKGDFVYFDPPYVPLSATSNFTAYGKDGFEIELQIELAKICEKLDKRGVKFLLSNSSAPLIEELYSSYNFQYVKAGRAINSKASKRGKVQEVLVSNYSDC